MNGRERLTAIFENRPADRPALKLWGFAPGQELMHPAYRPVYDLAHRTTDWFLSSSSDYDIHLGGRADELASVTVSPGPEGGWEDVTTVWRTPMGDLRSVYRRNRDGRPGYELEHMAKTARDVEAVLSIPYVPKPFDPAPWLAADRMAGDKGICMYGLSQAMYMLQYLMGPEHFAMLVYENRDVAEHAIAEFARRIRREAELAFDAGLKPVFNWVGPEVCIPPLMSPNDFEAFVFQVDKPLCDYIHERGGHVWMHCHGKVGRFIGRFIEMGIDVLNPIEPPPMGDITLSEAVDRFGSAVGLEGNIETHDLWSADSGRIRELVEEAVACGARSGRFVLCPSAGYMEFPDPTPRYIENLMTYLTAGLEQVNRYKY